MATTRRKTTRRTPARASEEWVGGHFLSTSYVLDPEPYRPEIVVWLSADAVLAGGVARPGDLLAEFAERLGQALGEPLVGAPRRPSSVRVADAALVPVVRAVLGDDIPVRVAPTPEVDDVAAEMARADARLPVTESYLDDGRLAPEAVGTLFRAAAALYRASPWKVFTRDSVVVALDAPALGLHEAAAIVMGGGGVEFGVMLFDTFEACTTFRDFSVSAAGAPPANNLDLGTRFVVIGFEKHDEIPPGMQAEVRRFHWELAGPAAWPRLRLVDRDASLRPVTEADLAKAVACCAALARFVTEHARHLTGKRPTALARYVIEELPERPEVVVSVPHPGAVAAGLEPSVEERREVAAWLDPFLASQPPERQAGPWRDAAREIVDVLLYWKLASEGARLDRWRAADLDEFLFGVMPDELSEASFEHVGSALDAFFAWACAAGRIDARTGKTVRAHVRRQTQRVHDARRDPALLALAAELEGLLGGAGDVASSEAALLGWRTDVLAGRREVPEALKKLLPPEAVAQLPSPARRGKAKPRRPR